MLQSSRYRALLPGLLLIAACLLNVMTGPSAAFTPVFAAVPLAAAALQGRRATLLYGLLAIVLIAVLQLPHESTTVATDERLRVFTVASVVVLALGINTLVTGMRESEASARVIAEAVQRAVVPDPAPQLGGVRLATRYRAAQREALIGGDLYAAELTPFGVRAILGDVRGKGLDATASVAVVLGSFREAAAHEPDLRTVGERMEKALRRAARKRASTGATDEDEGFVTAVMIEIPPDQPVTVAATSATSTASASAAPATSTSSATVTAPAAAAPPGSAPGSAPSVPQDTPPSAPSAPQDTPPSAPSAPPDTQPSAPADTQSSAPPGSAAPAAAGPAPDAGTVPADDSRAATVRLLNFGHPPPLLLTADGQVRPIHPDASALPLGLSYLATDPPEVVAARLPPGATLLLYTDGVTEARDAGDRFYDPVDRLRGARFGEPEELLDWLLADIDRHGGAGADDIALLAARRPEDSSGGDHGR